MTTLLTVTEAAERLSLSRSTLLNQIRAGVIRCERIGRLWVISEDEVERYRRERRGRPFGRAQSRRTEMDRNESITPEHLGTYATEADVVAYRRLVGLLDGDEEAAWNGGDWTAGLIARGYERTEDGRWIGPDGQLLE
jgi:excisionase family DNA binding protein